MPNLVQIRPRWASGQIGEITLFTFYLFIYTFFLQFTYKSDPSTDFDARWLKRRVFKQECACLLGIKKVEIDI